MTALLASVACRASLRGQQKVAAVAVRHLDYISTVAEIGYVFFQDNFHVKLSMLRAAIQTCRPPFVLDTGVSR